MIITQCGGQRAFKMSVIEEIMNKTMPQVGLRRASPDDFMLHHPSLSFIAQVMQGVGDALVSESERIASNINDLEGTFDPAK